MADKKAEPRDFSGVLIDLPQAHTAASEALQKVVEAVRLTGKVGSVTIKLKVGLHPNNDQVIDLTPDVTLTIPKQPIRGGSFYPDKDNNVSKEDPATLWRDSDLQDLPAHHAATGEIKDV